VVPRKKPRSSVVARRFGEELKRCRKKAELTQDEVANRAGIHRTEVSLLERGLREPRLGTVLNLAAALEVPVIDLVGPLATR
jgi:transcriptional regulator with XRE-family HTH domain